MQKLYFIILFTILSSFSSYAAIRHIEDIKQQGNMANRADSYDGIDVSSYQKDIDWEKVRRDKNIKFVYIKATEGSTYTSPHFEYNISNARKHGFKVGSYHFLRTTSSLKSQFDNFTKSACRNEQDLVPLIDIESKGSWSYKQIVDSLEAFAGMLRDYYNCEPMIYTMSSFFNSYLAANFSKYPLFIARYSPTAPSLKYNTPYTLWQYTDAGQVDGIDHRVDLCRFGDGYGLNNILIHGNRHKKKSSKEIMAEDAGVVEPDMHHITTPLKFKSSQNKKKDKKEKKDKKKKKDQEKADKLDKEQKAINRQSQPLKDENDKRRIQLEEKMRKDSIKAAKKK